MGKSDTHPPLLLLHGFTGSGENWAEQAACFRAVGLSVHTPDLPGHGINQPRASDDYTIFAAASQLVGLLENQRIDAIHLLGYSMGGRLALSFALRYPEKVKSLILESASPGLARAEERAARKASDDALAARIERGGIPAFVACWESLPLWKSQERLPLSVRQRLHERRLQNSVAGLAHSLRQMGTGVQPSLWERLGELSLPVLLLVGEEDEKFVAINRQMAERIPEARLAVIPHAGHTVHLEQPEAYQQAVCAFLFSLNRSADGTQTPPPVARPPDAPQ